MKVVTLVLMISVVAGFLISSAYAINSGENYLQLMICDDEWDGCMDMADRDQVSDTMCNENYFACMRN